MTPKLRVQATLESPIDFQLIDAADFAAFFPERPDPTGKSLSITGNEGYPWKVELCGMGFTADKHFCEVLSGGVVRYVTQNDDPRHYPAGSRYCIEFLLPPLGPDPDPVWNGCIRPRWTIKTYAEPNALIARVRDTLPWDKRPRPPYWRYGFEVPDDLVQRHIEKQTRCGWRHPCWNRHLDSIECDEAGFIRPQRAQGRYVRPDGTITYFLRDTNRATGAHTAPTWGQENALELTAGGGETETFSVPNNYQDIAGVWTTPTNEPNSAAWPTGVYRAQYDVDSWNGDLTGRMNVFNAHMARVDSGLTADQETETSGLTESITASGTTLFTSASLTWTAGNASDRFEIVLSVDNASTHGPDEDFVLTYDSDAFADGPWTAAGGAETIAATATGVATVATVATFRRTIPATATGVANINLGLTLSKTIEAVATGIATLQRRASFFRAISVVATGVAVLVAALSFPITITATATGIAAISILLGFSRTIDATATGVATLARRLLAERTIAAQATGIAAVNRVLQLLRTISATATGVATVVASAGQQFAETIAAVATGGGFARNRRKSRCCGAECPAEGSLAGHRGHLARTIAATATGVVTVALGLSLSRAIQATATGVASVNRRLSAFRTIAASATGVAVVTASRLFQIAISAVATGIAAVTSLFSPAPEEPTTPFTGGSGLGLGSTGRWRPRVRTWRRRR